MTARVAIWAAGLGASVVLNAALAGLVWLSIRPVPIAEQAMPQTRIDVQAHRLDRTEARPAEARGNPARTAPATGAPLSPGAIAKARAKPL
ncbi:MAG: hypothetical protein KDK02_06785, partial [Rhodobacteraceae bacterium]|nr:hypothetical protein [Paracoccaceae bacterium]